MGAGAFLKGLWAIRLSISRVSLLLAAYNESCFVFPPCVVSFKEMIVQLCTFSGNLFHCIPNNSFTVSSLTFVSISLYLK